MSSREIKIDKEDMSEVKFEAFNYQWKIKNFKHLFKKPGEYIESPVFSFGSHKEIKWNLKLYPNGNNKENENFLSVYLMRKHNTIFGYDGQLRMSLINYQEKKTGEEVINFNRKLVMENDGIGFCNYLIRDRVQNDPVCFMPDNCLTIHCEIVLSFSVNVVNEDNKWLSEPSEVNLKSNLLEKLFLQDDLSDVKLIATSSGKSLPAHRNILAACSPVFEAMFKNDMLEQKLGSVEINDGEYEVIKEMLRYIYLGKVENLQSIALELLKLTHKYQIAELVELCGKALAKQISKDNVFNIIDIANLYNIEYVKSRAIDFVRTQIENGLKSNNFESSTNLQALKKFFEAIGKP